MTPRAGVGGLHKTDMLELLLQLTVTLHTF